MKKINVMIATTVAASILALTSPVFSQTASDSRTTTTERHDDDDDTNYAWIGLLGLVGLAGLMKKNREIRDVRDTTTSPKFS